MFARSRLWVGGFLLLAVLTAGGTAQAYDPPYSVMPIMQAESSSAWAAAFAMMLTWKSGQSKSERDVVKAAAENGADFSKKYSDDKLLLGSEILTVAGALGLKAEASMSYAASDYATYLKTGPIWVSAPLSAAPSTACGRVRIVTGISDGQTPDQPILSVIDPRCGRSFTQTLEQFTEEIALIARMDLGTGQPTTPQIIHFP